MSEVQMYHCKSCGEKNPRDTRCPCGGPPASPSKTRRRGGRHLWFECECGHIGVRPIHCGYSEVRLGTQGDYRRALLQFRDGPGCQGCQTTEHLTIDHKVPKARGGSNHLRNLWVLCKQCNRDKADLSIEEWRAMLDSRLATNVG